MKFFTHRHVYSFTANTEKEIGQLLIKLAAFNMKIIRQLSEAIQYGSLIKVLQGDVSIEIEMELRFLERN